ncbi:MAG: hypothetical protein JKY86_15460 [Gammaproteobacteria bacterium]|nr:hypothetical protein [Gammaproteobacteria bacterium]
MKYRKKPVVIDAVQWTGLNSVDICSFAGPSIESIHPNKPFKINTLEGGHIASVGDYIIKGIAGEFYPRKPDIFKATYEEVK